MTSPLVLIATTFAIVFCSILLLRFVVAMFYIHIINKYLKNIILFHKRQTFEAQTSSAEHEDELKRDKELELKKLQKLSRLPGALTLTNKELVIGDVVVMQRQEDKEQELGNEKNFEKKEIVGIVKPIGRWTSLILGQKVSLLVENARTLKTRNDPGYWVNFVVGNEGMGRGLGGRGI